MGVPTSTRRQKLWLLASFAALLLLTLALNFEMHARLGPSPLNPGRGWDTRPSWFFRSLHHPHVVILIDDAGISLATLPALELGLADPRIRGSVSLRAQWTSPRDVWPAVVTERRLEVVVDATPPLDPAQSARVHEQFLDTITAWGHSSIASAIRRRHTTTSHPRWDGIWAHARAWMILLAFLGALLVFFGRATTAWARASSAPPLRERRRLRGLCARCEYPMMDLPQPKCPECGELLATS